MLCRICKTTTKFYNAYKLQVFKNNNSYILDIYNSSKANKKAQTIQELIKKAAVLLDVLTKEATNPDKVDALFLEYVDSIEWNKTKGTIHTEHLQDFLNFINSYNYKNIFEAIAENEKANIKALFNLNITTQATAERVIFTIENTETLQQQDTVLNGNYTSKSLHTFQYKNQNIDSVWYNITGKKDTKSRMFIIDFETTTNPETDETKVSSFSLCDVKRNYTMCTVNVIDNNNLYIAYMFTLLKELAKIEQDKKQEITIYCHNLKFDGSYIITFLLKNNYKSVQDLKSDKEFIVLYNKGSLISLKVNINNVTYIFKDTLKLINKPLADISREFAKFSELIIAKEDTNYNHNAYREKGYIYNNDEITYCINDVIATSYIISYMQDVLFGSLKLTVSSCAWSEFFLSFRYGAITTSTLKYMLYILAKQGVQDTSGEKLLFIDKANYKRFFIKINNKYCLKDYYNDNEETSVTDYESFIDYINTFNIKELQQQWQQTISEYPLTFTLSNRGYSEDLILYIISYIANTKENNNRIKDIFYNDYFPIIDKTIEAELREYGYRGGICVYNPEIVGQHYKIKGICKGYDIKSEYPSVLVENETPYGLPEIIDDWENLEWLKEQINNGETFNGQFVLLEIEGIITIKQNMLPCLRSSSCFDENHSYIYNGEIEKTIVSLNEFRLIQRIYNTDLYINKAYIFSTTKNLYKAYYTRYFKLKEKYKNTALYECVKMMCNSLTGKLGQNTESLKETYTTAEQTKNGVVYMLHERTKAEHIEKHEGALHQNKNGVMCVGYEYKEKETHNHTYLPVAIFATSEGRCKLMNAVCSVIEAGGRVHYDDTDSMFCEADTIETINNTLYINNKNTGIKVGSNLGDFEEQYSNITDLKVLAAKRYILKNDNKIICKCAGVNSAITKNFTFEDIDYRHTHEITKSKTGAYGRVIYKSLLQFENEHNIYICTDGASYETNQHYDKGDFVYDIYGNEKQIKDVIFEK